MGQRPPPTTEGNILSDLQQVLEQLRLKGELVTHVTSWRVVDARPAEYGQMPQELDPLLADMLAAQGIERLYVHQAHAVQEVLAGHNVVVVTPTASGKTLCYNLPVLNALLNDREVRALYLFPTKALAHDQLSHLQESSAFLGLGGCVAAYDGDTPSGARAQIRRSARILLSNPDMLHAGILPYHTRWREFFARLEYVIIDEIHHYRGIFGSHVANVLRRLRRICRFYGSEPQFICSSATIANPVELAQKLIERPVVLVSHNGAPRGQRTFVFYNPPIVDPQLGLRRPTLLEVRPLANYLLDHDVQTVIFGRSRLAVELLLTYLREDAAKAGRAPATLKGYRGGYLPAERRRIEEGLREGSVRGVAATNALELGVDIGGLSACIMAGYPGTIASTWQQAGRAGRGREDSVAFLVASSSPLDQYIIAHPDYFFGQSPEHALINPNNLYVLLSHVKCATFELPFASGESYGDGDVTEVLGYLEETGLVRRSGQAWHWAASTSPAHEISLRTADPNGVTICEQTEGEARRTIGGLDRGSVPLLLHEGAIYLHEGQQYLVESLDWEGGLALVRPVSVDYYTEASRSTNIHIERILAETHSPAMSLARGEVTLTSRVTGYRRLRLGSQEHLGWGEVNLPEQQMLTTACWMTVPEALVERLRAEGWWVGEHVESRGPSWPKQRDLARRRDGHRCRWCGAPERPGRQHEVHHIRPFREFKWIPGENENHLQANALSNLITLCPSCHRRAEQNVSVQSTLSRLGRVIGNLVALLLMCDPSDVSIHSDVQAPQTGLPTLFIVEGVPGGAGLNEEILPLYGELLGKAAELVRDCGCVAGCPSCIGPAEEQESRAKHQVLRLIAALQETPAS